MPVTLSYDIRTDDPNQRSYLRSMLERFGWTRLGGSVFRYDGRQIGRTRNREEDWLNDVAPSLMFFRSYCLHHNIEVRFFTLDAASVARVDNSDPAAPYGNQPLDSANIGLRAPTNTQSSADRIRRFLDAAVNIIR